MLNEKKNIETNTIEKEVIFDEEAIFCEEKSIGMSEFYQANSSGFKPEIKLIIPLIDYDKQKYVKYNDIEYRVIRTYIVPNSDDIELVLTGFIE